MSTSVRKSSLAGSWHASLNEFGDWTPSTYRLPVALGLGAIAILAIAFVIWSSYAPLASAIIAQGTVVVDSSRKSVQHLEGGIVEEIRVKDGDYITAGQTLVVLESSRLALARKTAERALATNSAQIARLEAECAGAGAIQFPDESEGIRLANFANITAQQADLFTARRAALKTQLATLQVETEQAVTQQEGVRKQIEFVITRRSLLAQDFRSAVALAATGDGTRQRVSMLSGSLAELSGELSSLESRAADAGLKAKHAELDGERAKASWQETAETDLQAAYRERTDDIDRLYNIREQLSRRQIRAPASGRVVDLSIHTPGGVIGPGASIMEIVPSNDRLLIEAQVAPGDIDHVYPGSPVDIRLSTYDAKRLPRLTGEVISVSADRLIDRLRGTPFFLIRISADNAMKNVGYELKPGMSVQVMVSTGDHTLIDYLLKPLMNFFATALKER